MVGVASASPDDRHDVECTVTTLYRAPAKGLAGIQRPRCEFVDIFSGRECGDPGEEHHQGRLLCPTHAMILALEHRVGILLRSLAVLDEWLDDNAVKVTDEVRVQRIKHWQVEVLERLDSTGLQLEAVRQEVE